MTAAWLLEIVIGGIIVSIKINRSIRGKALSLISQQQGNLQTEWLNDPLEKIKESKDLKSEM